MKTAFTKKQKTVLTMCVVMYTAAYVCRLNLSAALGGVMEAMSLSMARGGMLQTVFAAIYAAGQFVNGAIVDRTNPAKYMFAGLAGTAACNLLMGFANSYAALLAIWSLSAAFQSMMWTPVMRLLALYFRDESTRVRANETIALMLIVGHFIAWAIAGFVSAAAGWRFSFIIPALIAFGAAAWMGKTAFSLDVHRQEKQTQQARPKGENVLHVLAATGFFPVLMTCVLFGFIRDSVITWTPTILSGISGGDALVSTAFTLVLPAINMAGVELGFILRRRGAKPYGVVIMMMLAAALCSLPLHGGYGMLAMAVLLGLICAGMYGTNTMLTGLIPLEYDRVGRTSLTAGMVDSLIYVGSALAGAFAGGIFETMGDHALYACWAAAGAASALLMAAAGRMSGRYWKAH